MIEPQQIQDEMDVTWLEDLEDIDYVRQALDRLPGRRGRPAFHRPGRLVGYAVLRPEARTTRASGMFERRVFWLGPQDRDSGDPLYARSAPSEAVDPRTVAPCDVGYITERANGGPPSEAMRELGITLRT